MEYSYNQKAPIDRDFLEQAPQEFIIKRVMFLWDFRDEDFQTYRKLGLATEKELLYRIRHIEVGMAGSRYH